MSDYTAGRWWVVDPLAEDYYDWSPYNYCFNNPLLFVDPDGMGPFNKLPYNGSAWDYLKTIPNFATDIVNSVADLFLGGVGVLNTLVTEGVVPAAQDLSNGLVEGIGGGIYNRVEAGIDYHLHTPVVDQLKDAVSPQSLETALTIAVPIVAVGAAVNLTKGAATNVAKGTAKNTANGGLSNAQLVQKAATKAEAAIGGQGPVAGIAKHKYATNLLDRYQSIHGHRGLFPNHSFNNNLTLGSGNRGILDVLDKTSGVIYDFKFGKAVMSPAQYNKYYNNFGLPIQVIRP